jgi:hypothetical protein
VWRYESRQDGIYGIPLTYILEPAHKAMSACLNQRLDSASRANESVILVKSGSGIKKIFKNGRLRGGVFELDGVQSFSEDVKQFNISQPVTSLEGLENAMETRMQRVSSIGDYAQGVEQIQRPTATGQTALIQEGQQPLFLLLDSFRNAFAKIAKIKLARYKQFYPDGLELYRSLDPGGVESLRVVWEMGSIEDQVLIETKVSSATMNKQLRKQEALAFMDKFPSIAKTIMMFAQAATNPSPVTGVARKLLVIYQGLIAQMAVEFDVDPAMVNPDLTAELDYGLQMGTQQMQMQALAANLQQQGGGMEPGRSGPPQRKTGNGGSKSVPSQ